MNGSPFYVEVFTLRTIFFKKPFFSSVSLRPPLLIFLCPENLRRDSLFFHFQFCVFFFQVLPDPKLNNVLHQR